MFGSPALWPILEDAQAQGRDWFYGDHAYFGRFQYYRCTANGYQVCEVDPDATPHRWERHGLDIQPWRKAGEHILLCPQTPRFYALFGKNEQQWREEVCAQIRHYTDRPIVTRTKATPHPIAQDLDTAWAVVVWTSASALDALRAGVPAFATGQCAASPLALDDLSRIESPAYPDSREQLFWTLADNQWTLDEYRSGMAWTRLNKR